VKRGGNSALALMAFKQITNFRTCEALVAIPKSRNNLIGNRVASSIAEDVAR